MSFDNVKLIWGEKVSLFSFNLKKKQRPEEIKYFQSLYYEYKFLESNCIGKDEYGENIFDGTYSKSILYKRYKVYLRQKRFEHLPNWIAILISLISLGINLLLQLKLTGL